jgi:hypothetical protein
MTVSIQALAEEHIPHVVAACGDWRELAQFGPPYWRPRSPAELRRKIAASAGVAVSANSRWSVYRCPDHLDREVSTGGTVLCGDMPTRFGDTAQVSAARRVTERVSRCGRRS